MRANSSQFLLVAFALLASSCTEPIPSAPSDLELRLAKNAAGPTVTATDPSRGEPGQTLDVRVIGSGYAPGSNVSFALSGVTTNKIVTNRTTFVSSTEVVANITISTTADLTAYDVIVILSDGKKGIGTEKFLVSYQAMDLGTLSAMPGSQALDVNSSGVIVGTSGYGSNPNPDHAVRWTVTGPGTFTMEDLHPLLQPAYRTWANGINGSGTVIGYRQLDSSATSSRPFVLTSSGVLTTLHTLCGPTETSTQGQTMDINDGGDIVGYQWNPGSIPLYWAPGALCGAALPTLGGLQGEPVAISPNGQFIVGHSYDAAGKYTPVIWTRRADNSGWDISVLPGTVYGHPQGVADDGSVIGYEETTTVIRLKGQNVYDSDASAIFWPQGGAAQKLPGLGGDKTYSLGMNGGRIAGYGNATVDGPQHATIRESGKLIDLGAAYVGAASWATQTAGGYVVGSGWVNLAGRGTQTHAFVWYQSLLLSKPAL